MEPCWHPLNQIPHQAFEHIAAAQHKLECQDQSQFTHHLITGGPHHPGQNIEEVLPLQELGEAAASERAFESGRDRRWAVASLPWAGWACLRSTRARSTTGCRCVRSPDSACRCSRLLYWCHRHLRTRAKRSSVWRRRRVFCSVTSLSDRFCLKMLRSTAGRTHPRAQSCSLKVPCVSWTRCEPAGCSCSCQWCSSWCTPAGPSPSGSPCSNSPSCSAEEQEPARAEQRQEDHAVSGFLGGERHSCRVLGSCCRYLTRDELTWLNMAQSGWCAARFKLQSPFYHVDDEGVLGGVARLLHVSNPLKFILVIFAVQVLILWKH